MSGVGHAADKAGLKKYEIPATNDPNLKLEIVYQGNYTPGLRELNQFTPVTQFAFLGNNDILMLSKNDGKVLRVLNHKLISEPLLVLLPTSGKVVFWVLRSQRMQTKYTYFFIIRNQKVGTELIHHRLILHTISYTDTN